MSNAGDNLGTQNENENDSDSAGDTYSTRFGEAGSLQVTGPPPGKGGLPIELAGGKGGVTVTSVAPNSRVGIAGLTRGSRIIAVDGKKVTSPAQAKSALSGPIGSVILLEVSDTADGEESFTIVVQREKVP